MFLLLLTILTSSSYAGNTQIINPADMITTLNPLVQGIVDGKNDTICLPITDAKKVLSDAKQKPILLERIALLNSDVVLLNQRIAVKDSIIAAYQAKDGNYTAIIKALEDQKALMQEEKKLYQDQVATMEKMLRKERRKRFWTAAGGVISTGAMAYLFLTK
jgi:hypothetical protein